METLTVSERYLHLKNVKTCIQDSTSIYMRMGSETHNWKLQVASPLVGGGDLNIHYFSVHPSYTSPNHKMLPVNCGRPASNTPIQGFES